MVGVDLMKQAASELWAEAAARGLLFAGVIQQAASPGNLSQLQIRNPPASGKILYVASIRAYASVATIARIGRSDAALGTDVTTFGTMALGSGKVAMADLNRAVAASGIFTSGGHVFEVNLAAVSEIIDPRFPFRLPPGVGLVIEATAVNVALAANLIWSELDA